MGNSWFLTFIIICAIIYNVNTIKNKNFLKLKNNKKAETINSNNVNVKVLHYDLTPNSNYRDLSFVSLQDNDNNSLLKIRKKLTNSRVIIYIK
jgi:hypothetical protein